MNSLDARAQKLTELFFQLINRFHAHDSAIVHMQEGDLGMQEWKVVSILGEKKSCIMREIADCLGLAVSTLTGVVDRLVQKGLVRRERPDDDRRLVKVELTPQGRKAEHWHFQEHVQLSRAILQNLEAKDQEELLNLLHKVIQSDDARDAAPAP